MTNLTQQDISFHVENVEKALHRYANSADRENARISLGVLAQLAFKANREQESK